MSIAPEPSARYADLEGGSQYSEVYSALAQVVPPSEPHWLPSIAVAVQDLIDTCPWLGRELRYYVPRLQGLPDLVSYLRSSPPDGLPKEFVDEFPAQAALAIAPTKDSWLKPPKALMIAVALRTIFPSQSEESSTDIRAERGFAELVRVAKGLNYINVRQSREAFLKAAESESGPLAYATALCNCMEHPEQLPASQAARTARPDADLLRVLKRDILPLLKDLPAPKRPDAPRRETEDWERDDGDKPDIRIRLRLRSSPGSNEEALEDSVEISFDHISNLGHISSLDLAVFEDPFARRLSATQAIHSGNIFLSTFHADVLTASEIKLLLPAVLKVLEKSISDRDAGKVSLLLTVLLMFATGLTKERVVAILGNDERSAADMPFLSDTSEELIAPALNPDSVPQKGDQNQKLVFDQDRQIHIPLPPALALHLREFRQNFPSGVVSAELLRGIYPLLRTIADSVGLAAVTLGRLRRTAAPLLFNDCKDLVAVMHLTRDTFGRSLAPLHYVSFDESVLRGIYRRAMWPHFGGDPNKGNEPDTAGKSRLGSAFCPLPASAKSACAKIGSVLHAGKPPPDKATPREVADVHNVMATHLAALLVAVVGHRPHESLFRLTIHDFDLDRELGLFADKDIDPAHLTRIVAIGTEVSNQLQRYIHHLHGLIECKNLPSPSIAHLRRILKGLGPLIFRMDGRGDVQKWSVGSWQDMLSSQWRSLQPNFGRHYLASRGRELKYSPEWIHLQLGHQDVVGYPFSPDSPLFPVELANKVGPLTDKIFKEQGWKRRNGFKPASSLPDSWAETGPMRVTHSHSVRFRRKLNLARSRFQSELRAQLRPLKSQAERIVVEKAKAISLPLSEALCFRYNSQRQKREEELLDWPANDRSPPNNLEELKPVKLKLPKMELLLSTLEQEAGDNRALQIALKNQLAYAIEWLRKRRKYAGPYSGVYRMRPHPDESPFYEGIFRATKQIHALRELFSNLRASPFDKGTSEEMTWELGKAVLAVCIFGQVDDLGIVGELFFSKTEVERITASPDSLLVHLSQAETTVGLDGLAAIAYSRWKRIGSDLGDSLQNAEPTLDKALRSVLPAQCLRKGHGVKALLQTMRTANRVEMPGLFRTILDAEEGAVALPPDRLRSLLNPAYRAAGNGGTAVEVENWSLKRAHKINEIDAQVRILKKIIPGSDKKVILPMTGEIIRLKLQQHEPAREKLMKELHCWTSHVKYDSIVRYLAGWLRHLAQRQKFRGTGRLSWGSVASYFGKVALPLVGLVGRGRLTEHSVEDLEDLYLDLLSQLPENQQAETCTQLLSFHDFLVSEHGFEPVDTSTFREFTTRQSLHRNVSNQIVLPSERELINSHLQWLSDPDSHPAESQREFRIHAQAFLCFALAAATGARISEIAGLKHKDVIQIEQEIALILRSNGYRLLKTLSARRLVDAGVGLAPVIVHRFIRWLHAERDRIGIDRFHGEHIFCDLQDELIGTAALRSWYTPTMKAINNQVSSHHLRHTRVNEIFLELMLGVPFNELHEPERVGKSKEFPSCWPRDLVLRTGQIGHRRPRTSATCYFHAPFAAAIAAQRTLHGDDKKKEAAAMGISTSGWDNLSQHWKGNHVARFLDRCVRSQAPSGTTRNIARHSLPKPMATSLPRLSWAVDLLARGRSVATVRESIGLPVAQLESLMEEDRKQAINSGIALVPGNPNGTNRNSHYPRWRAGSILLQSLWSQVELEQDPTMYRLLRGWRLACNRSQRSIFIWDADLIATVEESIKNVQGIEISKEPKGRLYDVSITSQGCNVNHEMAYTLAVADVVASTLKTIGAH